MAINLPASAGHPEPPATGHDATPTGLAQPNGKDIFFILISAVRRSVLLKV